MHHSLSQTKATATLKWFSNEKDKNIFSAMQFSFVDMIKIDTQIVIATKNSILRTSPLNVQSLIARNK